MEVNTTKPQAKIKTFVGEVPNGIDNLDHNVNAFIFREKINPSDIIDIKVSPLSQNVACSTYSDSYKNLENEGDMYVVYTLVYVDTSANHY